MSTTAHTIDTPFPPAGGNMSRSTIKDLRRVITEAQHRLDDPFLNAQEAAELQNRIAAAQAHLSFLED